MAIPTKTKIIQSAIGRRKEAIASVRLISGSSDLIVNGKALKDYFPRSLEQKLINRPFAAIDSDKYSATVMVHGGGPIGQAEAVSLGIARSLSKIKDEFQLKLRAAGLLTRDPRTRQRRMVGMGGKSRRQKQSPKR